MADNPRAGRRGAGPALFRVVRFWARRWALGSIDDERHVRAIMVLEAVEASAKHDPDVSVNDVAHQLGIDQSGASRFVNHTIGDGHLERGASAVDRRRKALTITATGRELLAAAHRWQDEVFADLTADWDPADARQFAGHLQRLAAQLGSASRHSSRGRA